MMGENIAPKHVLDGLKLRFKTSMTPAGSNLGEHYQIL
jgi:hypothetical protein